MLLKKLVIAEDNDAIAHLLSASLGDEGYLCLRARDGEEALTLARTELPDALILDVMMPRLDGISVCKRLKSDVVFSQVPILMLTSLSSIDDRIAGFEAGADDYLIKPFDIRELTARVKALIRQTRRERTRNPTTSLPGGEAIEDHVSQLLSRKDPFVLLYVDLAHFRAFTDRYGYRRAETVISQVGQSILRQCRSVDPPAFVGHLGGDDFVLTCVPEVSSELCDQICEAFDSHVDHFYDADNPEPTRMRVAIARLDVEPGSFASMDALARAMTQAKASARKTSKAV